jgi:heat shock protein 1/8
MSSLGIDIGTCNSCCYVFDGSKQTEIAVLSPGLRHLTPSIVGYTHQAVLVGEAAERQQVENPTNTLYEFKRVIGRSHSDKTLWQHARNWPFVMVQDNTDVAFQIRRNETPEKVTPLELYRLMIRHLFDEATNQNGPVERITLTVPAHFNHLQRDLVRQACDVVNSDSVHILNEPTAAALAYMATQELAGRYWLVFDMGAGTTDVTVLEQTDGANVLGSQGHEHLGGSDFDQLLMDRFVRFAKTQHKRNMRTHKQKMAALRIACERAKQILSTSPEAIIEVDGLTLTIAKDEFEAMIRPKLNELSALVWALLQECNQEPDSINHVLLVGGCSRVPLVRQMLAEIFTADKIHNDIDPDVCVARGAARYCPTVFKSGNSCSTKSASQTNKCLTVVDVVPATLGLQTYQGTMTPLLHQNTSLPAEYTETFYPLYATQSFVDIRIYQGEHKQTSNNKHVTTMRLSLLAADATGEGLETKDRVPIEVTFRMDQHGLIHVDAKSSSARLTECVLISGNDKTTDNFYLQR